jgi:hypothetical protein
MSLSLKKKTANQNTMSDSNQIESYEEISFGSFPGELSDHDIELSNYSATQSVTHHNDGVEDIQHVDMPSHMIEAVHTNLAYPHRLTHQEDVHSPPQPNVVVQLPKPALVSPTPTIDNTSTIII